MPSEQVLVGAHQPQPVAFVHVAHVSWAGQLPQVCEVPNCHAPEQVELVGPLVEPARHMLRLGHQPQPVVAAQVEHVLCVLHAGVVGVVGSVGVVVLGVVPLVGHSVELQVHVGHVPVLGPDQIPDEQELLSGHQPHPVDLVQVAQVDCASQLPHVLFSMPYCHAAGQVSVPAGPLAVPTRHRFLLGHQPHPSVAAHVAHEVLEPHAPH